MKWLSEMRISRRLPLMTIGLILCVCVALSAFGMHHLAQALREKTSLQLGVLVEEYASSVQNWRESLQSDVVSRALDRATVDGFHALSSAHRLSPDGGAELRRLYVSENPFPRDEREKLTKADGEGFYHATHGRYHEQYLAWMTKMSFSDLYLINSDGHVIYSAKKKDDFGVNLKDNPQINPALARMFEEATGLERGVAIQSDFAPSAVQTGVQTALIAAQLIRNDETVGVMVAEVPLAKLNAILPTAEYLREHGDVYVVGGDGRARTPSRTGTRFDIMDVPPVLASAPFAASDAAEVVQYENGLIARRPIDGTGWWLVAELRESYFSRDLRRFGSALLLSAAVMIGLSIVLGFAVARSITRPLGGFSNAMLLVAQGDYESEIPGQNRKDELGDLSRTLAGFKERLQEGEVARVERETASDEQHAVMATFTDHLGRLAQGDLTATIDHQFPDVYEGLRQNFNDTLLTLNDMMYSVVENASEIQNRANEISASSSDLSKRTENQAATLEQTAAALDQLTGSVRAAADSAAKVEVVVRSANQDVQDSGEVVRNAVGAMSEIKQSSDEITQIIGVIDDIAFQTNLLALNAGVEAARAGEAGRGFAVVASEVRALAQRSSDAAKEIKSLIGASSGQVKTGVSLVDRAGEALDGIVEQIKNISDLVADIASGAQEQASGLGEINVGVTQLDQVTQQNAAMVEQSTAATITLKQESSALNSLVARFRLRDDPASTGRDVGSAIRGSGDEATLVGSESDAIPVIPFRHREADSGAEDAADAAWPDPTPHEMAANEGTWKDF